MNNEEMRKMWEEAANGNKQEKKPGILDTVREKLKKYNEVDNSDAVRERLKNKERDDSYNKHLDDHSKKHPEQAALNDKYRPNRYNKDI